MTVFKRGDKWVAQVREPGTGKNRQVGTYRLKRDALTAESEARRLDLTHGVTVKEWADRWMRDFRAPKESTNITRHYRLQPLLRDFGPRRMDSITVLEARAWALQHRGQFITARAMWNDARRAGLLERNPWERLGIEQSRGRRDLKAGWLTASDIEHLAQCARDTWGRYGEILAGGIILAAYTGIRAGELFALEHRDLRHDEIDITRSADSHSRTITTPKNGASRTIVFPRVAREAVERMPRMDGVPLVLPTPRGGMFFQPTLHYYWRPVRAAAGRPGMAWHELRHHAATHLLELGVSAADVAGQLGHVDGGRLVNEVYGHADSAISRARVRQALDGYESGDLHALRREIG